MLKDNSIFNGRAIAVPESRQLDVFCDMLSNRGAKVVRCPMLSIIDSSDVENIKGWLFQFVTGQCDDLIVMTAEGLRRLYGVATEHNIGEDFIEALKLCRLIVRGPKPGRFLREFKIKPHYVASPATTEGMISLIQQLEFAGSNVGLQLYGDEPSLGIREAVTQKGGKVLPVAPYTYASDVDDELVLSLFEQIRGGHIDAIAFTSMIQVKRLAKLSKKYALGETYLSETLAKCCVAAVGPVVARELEANGVRIDVMPEQKFFMKPLVNALAEKLNRQ